MSKGKHIQKAAKKVGNVVATVEVKDVVKEPVKVEAKKLDKLDELKLIAEKLGKDLVQYGFDKEKKGLSGSRFINAGREVLYMEKNVIIK